ncbi:unnamed protein product [Prorocentrum cordatum]|uniref:Uncharacterized protein n=1 Tax=Prorocentrum cordatum TaxID=2364126 RepID=A0ABN9Y1E2_9DINO|nr:unnamed protein product [Polarella glacialis]
MHAPGDLRRSKRSVRSFEFTCGCAASPRLLLLLLLLPLLLLLSIIIILLLRQVAEPKDPKVRTTVRRPLWHRHARTPQTGHRQHAHDRTGGHGPAGEQQRQQQRPPRRPPALRHGPASAPVSGSSRAEGGPTWKTEAA